MESSNHKYHTSSRGETGQRVYVGMGVGGGGGKSAFILANCPYLIGTVPILTQEKGRKKSDFIMCSYFCKICL